MTTVLAPNLIQETAAGTQGKGTLNANCYGTLAGAQQYFANTGNKAAQGRSDADLTTALIRAASGMDYWLVGRWHGRRASQNQPLDWPRCEVRDQDGYCWKDNIIPPKIVTANYEIASIELTTPFIQLKVDKYDNPSTESAGPVSIGFKPTAPSITYWPQIIAILKDYATIGVMPIELVIGLTEHERKQLRSHGNEVYANPFDFPDYFHLIKEAIYNPGYDAPWLC
jgi:hypothetical protein